MAAHHHLRQVLYALNVAALPSQEVYSPNAATLFDEGGQLTDTATREFMTTVMRSFETWIEKIAPGPGA
jgi:NAD(P)H-dependent FMN reductase